MKILAFLWAYHFEEVLGLKTPQSFKGYRVERGFFYFQVLIWNLFLYNLLTLNYRLLVWQKLCYTNVKWVDATLPMPLVLR